jgi:uncharacterized membrane protein YkvA (DUF1232 family)
MSGRSKGSPGVNGEGFDANEVIDASRALTPAVTRVNEQKVREGLIPKLRRVAAKIPFATDVLALWYCARDPATPASAKGLMLAGLAYFVLPTDAIPDILAGIGYTDDAAVIAAVLALVGRNIKESHRVSARAALAKFAGDE